MSNLLQAGVGLDLSPLERDSRKAAKMLNALGIKKDITVDTSKSIAAIQSLRTAMKDLSGKYKIGREIFNFDAAKADIKDIDRLLKALNSGQKITFNGVKLNKASIGQMAHRIQSMFDPSIQSAYNQSMRQWDRMRQQQARQKVDIRTLPGYVEPVYGPRDNSKARFMSHLQSIDNSYKPSAEMVRLNDWYREQERQAAENERIKKQIAKEDAARIKAAQQNAQLEERAGQQRLRNTIKNAQYNSALQDSYKKLSDAQNRYNNARQANSGKSVQEIQREISALRQLIRVKERNLQLQTGRRGSSDAQLSGYRTTLNALQNQKNKLQDINRLYGSQGGILARLGNLAASYFNIYALANFVKRVSEVTGYFERQRVSLEGITGSAAKANAVLTELTNFATRSPFQAKDLIGFAKQLSAFSIPADELVDTTKKLADISAGLGVDMSRIILAYGQVKSASVLRGQELRQFTEAGIPMVDALAKKVSELNGEFVTTGQIFEMISKRQISFEMVDSVLSDMTAEGGKFYKMQENLTGTLYGQIQKLKDLWTIALNDIGKNNNGFLVRTVSLLQYAAKNAKSFGNALAVALSTHVFIKITVAFQQLIKLINTASLSLKAMGGWITAIIGVVSYAVATIVNDTNRLKQELADIDTASNKEYNRLSSGLDRLLQKLAAATAGTKEYNKALDSLKSNYGDYINESLIDALVKERQELDKTAESWGILQKAIKAAIKERQEYERHKQRKETVGNTIVSNITESGLFLSKIERTLNEVLGIGKYTGESGRTYARKWDARDAYTDSDRKKMKDAINYAVENFFNNGLTTKDEFKKELESSAKEYAPKYASMLTDLYEHFFKTFADSEAFKKYKEEHTIIANNPRRIAEERWKKAVEDANSSQEGRWEGNAESKKIINKESTAYNPFLWSQNAQEVYTKAIDENVIAFSRDLKKVYNEASASDKGKIISDANKYNETIAKLNDEFAKINGTDVSQPSRIVNAINDVLDVITNPEYYNRLIDLRDEFVKLAGTTSGVSETIKKNIVNNFGKDKAFTVAQKQFFANYVPNEQNLEEKRNKLIDTYRANKQFIDDHRIDSVWKNEIEEKKLQNEWIKILAGRQYYDIVNLDKNSGGGIQGNYTRFFADLFGMIKSAYTEQKKLVEGYTGVTNVLTEEINNLSDDNILKGFYQKDKNPFKPFLDKIQEYDLETIFSAKDFEGLRTLFKEGVGIDEIDIADFEKIWDALLKIVKDKAEELRKAGKGKEASKVEAYGQTMTSEKLKFFGGDEIAKKVDEAVKALTNIENIAKLNTDMYRDIQEMMKTGDYREVWKLMTGGKPYQERSEEAFAKQTLDSVINNSTAGKAISSFIGADLNAILQEGQLGISFIPELYAIIRKVGDIGNELKTENGEIIDAKEIERTKNTFIKALEDLIKGIKEETKKLAETRTPEEKQTDRMKEREKEKNDREKLLNDLRNGIKEIDSKTGIENTVQITDKEYNARMESSRQQYVEDLAKELGGAFSESIANVTRANTETGSSAGGDLLQKMFSLQNGGLESMINTGFAQNVAAENMSAEAASAASGAMGGGFAMVDMIIKGVYQTIKAMTQIAKATIDTMKAFDDVTSINIDEVGVMQVKTAYGDFDFEKANEAIDTVATFNQHVMDGWEKVKSGDLIGSFVEVYTSITDMIQSVVKMSDMDLQRQIESMQRITEDLSNAATNLNASAERMVGFERVNTQLDATGKSLEQAQMYKDMIDAEDQKKKSDGDKMREWQQSYMEAMNEFLNGIRQLRDEMVSSTEDWANAMGEAIRSAFQSGENAARSFRDTVKTMIGDVIERMLQMAILEPLIENAIEGWTNSDYLRQKYTKTYTDEDGFKRTEFDSENFLKETKENIMDPKKADDFYKQMLVVGTTLIDSVNGLPSNLQDYYKHNSELSTLSGGIEGVTEDTARRIEALENSQLGELFAIRMLLENYIAASDGYGNSTMASLQAATVRIASDTSLIRIATESILAQIKELRTSPTQPIHVTMV